jgi:hypothetical protein
VLARLAPEHRPVLEFARQLYLTTRYADETWSDELNAQIAPHVDEVSPRSIGCTLHCTLVRSVVLPCRQAFAARRTDFRVAPEIPHDM